MANEVKSIWPVALLVICLIALSTTFTIMAINKNADKPVNIALDLSNVTSAINAQSAKIDALAVANTTPASAAPEEVDVPTLEKLCSLTDGCLFYKPTDSQKTNLLGLVTAKIDSDSKDFIKVVSALTEIDKDYLEFTVVDVSYKDENQVRAATASDKKEGNWEVQTLVKVKYWDSDREDSSDTSTMYVLVKSTLDEGEYDKLTGEKVTRDFTFE